MAKTSKKQKRQDHFPNNSYSQTPFNFCDRWCERCNLVDQCQIFQHAFSHQLEHMVRGEDPNDSAVIMADMKKTFHYLVETIKKDIEKYGLDSRKLKVKIVKAGLNQGPRPETFVLWRLGHNFMLQNRVLLQNIFSEQDEELQEIFTKFKKRIEELNWYHTFFEAKLYQALAIQKDLKKEKNKTFKQIQTQEMNVSAKLCFYGLQACQIALEELSQNCPGYMKWTRDLSILGRSILEKIETRFPNCHQNKIIFHG
ncbi:hypothetical protein KKG58_00625 [Patescibacteria group bacterium]|nr:hypothetical protein [Patescibacteria group bacterium]